LTSSSHVDQKNDMCTHLLHSLYIKTFESRKGKLMNRNNKQVVLQVYDLETIKEWFFWRITSSQCLNILSEIGKNIGNRQLTPWDIIIDSIYNDLLAFLIAIKPIQPWKSNSFFSSLFSSIKLRYFENTHDTICFILDYIYHWILQIKSCKAMF
jgi:hypothetical protein